MKKILLSTGSTFLMILIALLAPALLHAQPGDPYVDPAPVDGGVSILAAACAGYLAKQRKSKHNNKTK